MLNAEVLLCSATLCYALMNSLYKIMNKGPNYETLKDSPQPHCSVMFGFLNTNRLLSLSSTQSISLPIMFIRALLSIKTLTPSCSTCSSSIPGLSTYSRWYANPEQPFAFVPMRISFGSGWSSSSLKCATAEFESFIVALRAAKLYRLGLKEEGLGAGVGLLFCASLSGTLKFDLFSNPDTVPLPLCSANLGGCLSFISGMPPVSRTLKLRGGGGSGLNVDGWYALAVCSCRFDDCRKALEEEKVRRH